MSIRMLCDCCNKIIYDKGTGQKATLKVEITNRYNTNDWETYKHELHLCEGCDLQIAKALVRVLPNIAGDIEPNVFHEPEWENR